MNLNLGISVYNNVCQRFVLDSIFHLHSKVLATCFNNNIILIIQELFPQWKHQISHLIYTLSCGERIFINFLVLVATAGLNLNPNLSLYANTKYDCFKSDDANIGMSTILSDWNSGFDSHRHYAIRIF